MVNARAKGNRGERECKKLLAPWWGGKWERRSMGVPGSDLVTPEDFPCEVEAKNSNAVALVHYFQPNTTLSDWWSQTKKQCRNGKLPMLCMKTSSSWYCAMKMRDFLSTGWNLPATYLLSQWTEDDLVVVMRIKQFIASNPKAVTSGAEE